MEQIAILNPREGRWPTAASFLVHKIWLATVLPCELVMVLRRRHGCIASDLKSAAWWARRIWRRPKKGRLHAEKCADDMIGFLRKVKAQKLDAFAPVNPPFPV
jgi:hypothetical protein